MSSPPLWRRAWDRGLAAVGLGSYDEGLTAMDEAVELGSSDLELFAPRADVLAVLRQLESVYTKDQPPQEDDQDDCARLFGQLAALPKPLQALILASSTPHPSVNRQLKQARKVGENLWQPRNFIDRLPAELLSEIGRHVVFSPDQPSSELALPLTAVSRRWRTVLLGDKSLWRHQRITWNAGDPVAQVAGVLRLGPPQGLLIKPGRRHLRVDRNPGKSVLEALKGKGSKLERLDVVLDDAAGLGHVWAVVHPRLCSVDDEPACVSLRELRVQSYSGLAIGLLPPRFLLPALTHLNLQDVGVTSWSSLCPILSRLPNLRDLSLRDLEPRVWTMPPLGGPGQLQSITLGRLTTFTVDGLGFPSGFHFIAPRLGSLTIRNQRHAKLDTFLFPPAESTNTTELHTLHLENAFLPSPPALDLMPALTSLTFVNNWGTSFEALVNILTVNVQDPSPVCPLLERIHLRGEMSRFWSGSFLKMAKSRDTSPHAARLHELMLEAPRGPRWKKKIELDLRKHVDSVVCGFVEEDDDEVEVVWQPAAFPPGGLPAQAWPAPPPAPVVPPPVAAHHVPLMPIFAWPAPVLPPNPAPVPAQGPAPHHVVSLLSSDDDDSDDDSV